MDVPPYIQGEDQENYNIELNQTLSDNFGLYGCVIPSLTNAQLTTDLIPDGAGGLTTVAALKPNGTMWFITDHVPPVYVGKISGALVKFTTAAYP